MKYIVGKDNGSRNIRINCSRSGTNRTRIGGMCCGRKSGSRSRVKIEGNAAADTAEAK